MMIERMANGLGLSRAFIEKVARSASHEYKVYLVPKRTGGFREIHHPSRRLKALQRWLLENVLEALPVHTSATAYRKGQSILDNANVHVASRYLLRMDLKEFFPSITAGDLRSYIVEHPMFFAGWTPSDVDIFCRLVCRNSVLTIGAPSSPALSNAVCYELDVGLSALAARSGVTYTRYADDLFFSSGRPGVLRQIEKGVGNVVAALKLPSNLKINVDKTRHSSKRGARRVTGIVLGSDGRTHVGRCFKRKVRALIHAFDSLDEPARASLAGMIAYATGLDPDFMNSLVQKYGLPRVRKSMGMPIAGK